MKEAGLSPFFWSIPREDVECLDKHAIIDLIRFTPYGISRVGFPRQLSLLRAANAASVNDLRAIGLVSEVEGRQLSMVIIEDGLCRSGDLRLEPIRHTVTKKSKNGIQTVADFDCAFRRTLFREGSRGSGAFTRNS